MSSIGPLAPLIGAAAMIGLALATALGIRRPPAPPPPAPPTPADAIRHALAAFAHWLPPQPEAVRRAVAEPATRLLSDGANLAEALAFTTDADRLLAMPPLVAAHAALTRDLPDTMAILDALPVQARTAPSALAPFAGAIATIAAATTTAWDALQADTITALEIQRSYLGSKYPGSG